MCWLIIVLPASWWGNFVQQIKFGFFSWYIFSQTVPVTALKHIDVSNNFDDFIENFVDFINGHGIFTVVICYSRDEMYDKSSIGMEIQSK